MAGLGTQLGPVLGEGAALTPRFDTAMSFREVIDNPAFAQALPGVAAAAFGLALISSLDTLLLLKAFERITHDRQDSPRELARIGLANTVAACLGALPCSIGLAASQSNHAAGGRGAISVVVHGVIALAAVLALGWLVAAIPRAVVAALMLSIAFVVLDRPTIATIRRLASGTVRNRARLATDVLVMLAVATIAIVGSVALAVVAGVGIAVLSFLVNMSHSVVRRVTRGDATRSRRSRGTEQMAVLALLGSRIAVIELEGVIFFGTADDLLARIEQCLREGAQHVIVDLGRVNDVDTTGAQMLIQIHERVRARGGLLLVSQAATGVVVYRDTAIPQLTGRVLWGDLPSGEVFHVPADGLRGGQAAIRRVLFREGNVGRTFLEVIQAENVEQGRTPSRRADLHFGRGPAGRVFLLDKWDGVVREIVP
jgi:MFS superfamily sulfate permease-like transporter